MKYRFINEYITESLGEECILLPRVEGNFDIKHCVYLEGSAEEILELLKENTDSDNVMKIICEKYNEEEVRIREDIEDILDILIQTKLVEEV